MKTRWTAYVVITGFLFFSLGLAFGFQFSNHKNDLPTRGYVLSKNNSGTGSVDNIAYCEDNGCIWVNDTCDCSGSSTTTSTFEPTQEPDPTSTLDSEPEPTATDNYDYDKALRCEEYGCAWANDTCLCEETATKTQSPTETATPVETDSNSGTTTDDSSGTGGYTIDRLSTVDHGTLSCIKERLTSSELDIIRYLIPSTTTEEDILKNLQEKAAICFETYTETKSIELASSEVVKIEDEVQSCLLGKIGEQAFNEINSGLREPTTIELIRSEECFEGEHESTISYRSSNEELDDEISSCLALALGQEEFDKTSTGEHELTLEQLEKVQRCFGEDPHPLAGPPKTQLSPEISSCLLSVVGQARFGQISSGEYVPTQDEREKGEACFEDINEVQKNLLPPPPEQVLFLEESNDVTVGSVDQLINKTEEGVVDQTIILKGTGPANSIVDIVIFSEPIVVTTTTDENGDWVYELKDPIAGTTHIAYATVRDSSGRRVRSTVFNFDVIAASDLEAAAPLLDESQVAGSAQNFVQSAAIIILAVFALASLFIGFINVKKLFAKTNSLGGEGDGEDTPGSIN